MKEIGLSRDTLIEFGMPGYPTVSIAIQRDEDVEAENFMRVVNRMYSALIVLRDDIQNDEHHA